MMGMTWYDPTAREEMLCSCVYGRPDDNWVGYLFVVVVIVVLAVAVIVLVGLLRRKPCDGVVWCGCWHAILGSCRWLRKKDELSGWLCAVLNQ